MKFSFFQLLLLLVLLALISCVSEKISTSEQPNRRSFFRKVGNVYKKTRQGLRNMFSWKRRGARGTQDEGHVEQNPIGEGIGAVMEVIDEIVADGEVEAAAKNAKKAVDKSEKAVEPPALESEEKIPHTVNVEEEPEPERKMDRTHVEDEDDSNTNNNDNDEVEATASEDENKEVKPASHDTASDVASSSGDGDGDGATTDRTANAKASDTKEEL